MKRILVIIFVLSSTLLYGQADFGSAVDKGYYAPTGAKSPTSGIYTYNPRIEGDYYIVDFYGRCYNTKAWESILFGGGLNVSQVVGSFGVSLQMTKSEDKFNKKFESFSFELDPAFKLASGKNNVVPEMQPNIATSTGQFAFMYKSNGDVLFEMMTFSIKIQVGVPYHLGQMKLKIKSDAKSQKAGFSWLATSSSCGVWDNTPENTAGSASFAYNVVGWLDGKDPDILLSPEVESTKPANPVFDPAPASLCAMTSGNYTLTKMPDKAEACEWNVSETKGGAPITDNNICGVVPNAQTTGATIQWNAGAGGKTYWVNVRAKNGASPVEYSDWVSTQVTVKAVPNVVLAVTKGGTTLNKESVSECAGVALTLSVANTAGVTYDWSGGVTGSGYTKNVTLVNTGTANTTQQYTVEGNADGCKATDNVTVTIKPVPGGLYFDPALSATYPSGQMLSGITVKRASGASIDTWNWTSPVISTDQSIDFTVQNGTTTVTAEVGNTASGCKATITKDITSSGGLVLALSSIYGDGKICTGGVARLKVDVSGATNATYQYQWYTGNTPTGAPIRDVSGITDASDYLTVSVAGDYCVKVTTNSALSASSPITVGSNVITPIGGVRVEPVIIAATPSRQVVLLAEPTSMGSYTWEWTPANMLASGQAGLQSALTAPITKETTYEVFMKAGNCVNSAKTIVKLPSNDLALTVVPTSANLCLGNKQQLKATLTGGSGAESYIWTPAEFLSETAVSNPVFTPPVSATDKTYTYIVKATKGLEVVTSQVTLKVSAKNAPSLTLPTDIYCAGNELVAVDSKNTAQKFNWTITNSSNNTTTNTTTVPRIALSGTGKYTVKVVGEITGECVSDTASIDIELRQPTLSQALSSSTYLAGGTVSSTATAANGWEPYTYTWTSPGSLTGLGKNVYTVNSASLSSYNFAVSIADFHGCTATTPDKEATRAAGGLTLTLDTMYAYCNGGMAMLRAKVEGGTPGYNYTWKKVGDAADIVGATGSTYLVESPAAGDVYQVTVTDNSSPALTLTATVNLDAKKKAADAPGLTTPGLITIGQYQQAILSATTDAASVSRWNWEPVDKLVAGEATKPYAKTRQLSVDQLYSVYIVDNKGCISQKAPLNVKVVNDNTNFDVAINASTLMCQGGKQTLGVTLTPNQEGATYSWSSVPDMFAGADMTNPSKPVITAPASGKYTVAVTVRNSSGIKNTAIQNIDVKADMLPTLTLAFNSQVCEGDIVTASVTNMNIKGNVYTWYVNGVKQTETTSQLAIVGSGSQIIKVVATGENECTGEKEDTKTVNARPTLAWNPVPKSSIEVGESLTAIVLPGPKTLTDYDYTWTSTKTGTKNNNEYTVTAESGDAKISLTAVAQDKVTTCKSLPVTADVTVSKAALTPVIAMIGKACVNGSAVLDVVSVEGDEGPYTYEWTKVGDATNTVLGTDKRLVISPLANTDANTYKVVVTKVGTTKKGDATQLVQAVVSAQVPEIRACQDVTIGVGEQAVLTAVYTKATEPVIWNWMPENKIVSGESHFESPKTVALNANTQFGVYLIDGGVDKCVSPVSNVNVIINGSKALAVDIEPSTTTFCIGNKINFNAKVSGGSGNIESYEWVNSGNSRGTSAVYAYTATKAMTDTITLIVRKGGVTGTARKVITIKPFTAPILEFVNENAVKCAGNILEVRTKNNQAIVGNYSWVVTKEGSAPQSASSDRYSFASAGKYNVKVTANNTECALDTISTDVTIAPVPEIVAINIEKTCKEAKVVAVTNYADEWVWESTNTIEGATKPGVDSVYYFKTTEISKNFSGKLVAENAAGCASAEQAFNGTTYSLPAITLNPQTKEVYPNTKVDITATLAPALAYDLKWKQTAFIESDPTKNTIRTIALPASDDPYEFTIVVQNTASPTVCKDSATATVTVDSKDFRVEFEKDTIDVCQNVAHQFVVTPVNNKFPPVTYQFALDGIDIQAASQVNSITKTFPAPGKYKLSVVAKNNNPIPDVRYDTVVVRVNQTPSLNVTSPALSEEYSLCDKRGKIDVVMNVSGTPNWTLYYRLGGANKTEAITATAHTMVLKQGGEVYLDSIVDSKGCKAAYTDGFVIVDDVPRIALTSTDAFKKCQGAKTDLGIQISNTMPEDYTLKLFYKEGPLKKTFDFTSSATKFESTYQGGIYTIDSIVSKRGCVYRLTANNQVRVDDYPETNPTLAFANTDPQSFCEGSSLNIPITVTGGKANYTIDYTLNGVSKTATLTTSAGGTIAVDDNGPFVLKKFTDANGCGIYTADQTIQITKNVKPAMTITTTERLLCGGSLDLGLSFTKGTAPYKVYYTLDGGAEQTKTFKTDDGSLLGDKTAVWNITNKGSIVISKVTDANCEIAGAEVTNGPTIAVDSFRLYAKFDGSEASCATAAAKIKIDFSGTSWDQVVGGIRLDYEYTPAGGSTAQPNSITITKAVAQNGNGAITNLAQGKYVLVGITDLKGSGAVPACSGILPKVASDREVTVIKAPKVEIDSSDFAARKNEPFVLGIKDADPLDFKYEWEKVPGQITEAVAPKYSLNGVMADADLQYVLKGTNKTDNSCYSTDTVNIYRIPDAPVIKIDTNTNRSNIKISWDVATGADNYVIMHNKWDGYAIKTAYSQKANMSKESLFYDINTVSLDTLELFYLVADRTVNGKKYSSVSSDTVGYYKQTIYGKNLGNALKGANNLIAYPFDMSGKGIVTDVDLFKRLFAVELLDKDFTIAAYDFATQAFRYHNYIGDFDAWDGVEFNLQPGSSYMLTISNSVAKSDLLMYGKLPKRFVYDFKLNSVESKRTSFSLALFPLSMIDKHKRQDMGEQIPSCTYIGIWDFTQQAYRYAGWFDDFGIWDPDPVSDPISVKVWTPMSILVGTPQTGWQK